jgi:hypothetical protein
VLSAWMLLSNERIQTVIIPAMRTLLAFSVRQKDLNDI